MPLPEPSGPNPSPTANNTAIIPSTRPDYSAEQQAAWLARHDALVELARLGRTEVAFFGDSLTEQWGAAGRAEWDRAFAPLGADNFGIGGDRTQQVLWRMQHGELDGMRPRALVLLIGTNNTDPGMGGEASLTPRNTGPEIIAGVGAIIACVRHRLPAARLLVQGILPRGAKGSPVRSLIKEINTGLRAYEDARGTVRFVDFGSAFLTPDGSLSEGILPDQLHLSEAGYRVWAGHLRPSLHAVLRA